MLSHNVRGIAAGVVGAGLAVFISTQVLAARPAPVALGGKDRYLTSVATDKPIYHPGDKAYVRGTVLHAFKHSPLPPGAQSQVTIEVKGPKGDTVASGYAQSVDSVWAFAWDIPASQSGGEYTVHATYPWTGHAPAERKFDVRVFRAPRLKSQIVFMRDGYGPGDKVSATLDVKRAEGGSPVGAKVTAIARLDGVEVARVPGTVDERGLCTVSFDLPKAIARGDGSLAFAIEDGGVVETASKTLPILLQTVDLKLYPEGGDLVAGLAARVYFEARTPAQKPGDLAGVVVNGKGAEVARFRSEHEGRGRFAFTPEKGERYTLKVLEPAGIKTAYPLPEVKPAGTVLRSGQDVAPRGKPVKLWVASTLDAKLKVTLSQRDVEVASAAVSPSKGLEVSLDPKGADGVLVATVWDSNGVPLAERLVFRQSAEPLTIEVRADKKSYVPGDTVKLTARTTRAGRPVSAVVGLSVTDDAVLEMVEKREQAPQLPAMALLEPEVKELADAHVYLDEANPKAPLAVDLLLGTQGWRRFAFVDPTTFIAQNGDEARRVLALRIQSQQELNRVLEDDALGGGVMLGNAVPRGRAEAVPDMAVAAVAPPMPMPPQDAPPPPPPAPVVMADEARMDLPAASARDLKDETALQGALAHANAEKQKRDLFAGAKAAAPREPPAPRQDLVLVREFAHAVRAGRQPTDRLDFAETLYWNAGVKTDAKTGEAQVSFALNDSVTTFKAISGGFTADGNLGAAVTTVEAVQPFYLEPKLPLEVTAGDVVQLPIALVNGTAGKLSGATVTGQSKGELRIGAVAALDLKSGERGRRLMELKVGNGSGKVDFVLAGRAGAYADTVTRPLSLKPNGFPFEAAFGGMLGPDQPATHALTLPENLVVNSVKTNIAVYPTPLANMTEALSRLIVDPSGCFEQTSSTSYPLTMAQQYFTSHTGVDPALVQSAKEKLEAGYKRLTGFECSQKGYEWFGENPGHEALTAYGLLHFTDMAKVRDVDQTMLANTRAWLMKQRDGKGGFERKRRALHTWIEDKDCSNAYITWALLESGEKELGKEVALLKDAAAKSQNSYVLALAGNVMALAKEGAEAKKLNERLAAKQAKDGSVGGATQSIVGSGGEALTIEATALATLSWMRDPAYAGAVERAMKFLADSCKSGRYGSTQSTVLALRAIVTYDKARSRPKAPGAVRVYVDGQPVGSAVAFDVKTQGAIKLPDVSELLTKGKHTVEVKMTGGATMPYSIGVTYSALKADSSKDCKVAIDVKLSKATVAEGELLEANATVTNLSKELVPTTIAIVGLPGGLEPRHDQLKELVKKGTIDSYEVLGREVVLYWRGMTPGQKIEVPLSLLAAVPGSYTGPASRAYLYYTDEHKVWTDGLKVAITPKG